MCYQNQSLHSWPEIVASLCGQYHTCASIVRKMASLSGKNKTCFRTKPVKVALSH